MTYTVHLKGGKPWGIRLKGGMDASEPLHISMVSVAQIQN